MKQKLPIYAFMQVIYHIISFLSTYISKITLSFLDGFRDLAYNRQKYEL